MSEVININEFDSFEGASFRNQQNDYQNQEIVINKENMETDNKFVQNLMRDYNLNLEGLKNLVASMFPGYNSDYTLSQNLNTIFDKLQAKKEAGEELSNFEKTFFSLMQKAKGELETVRKEQTLIALKENLPYVLIGAVVLIFIGKKL